VLEGDLAVVRIDLLDLAIGYRVRRRRRHLTWTGADLGMARHRQGNAHGQGGDGEQTLDGGHDDL
jgi:hypothetical protein